MQTAQQQIYPTANTWNDPYVTPYIPVVDYDMDISDDGSEDVLIWLAEVTPGGGWTVIGFALLGFTVLTWLKFKGHVKKWIRKAVSDE